MGEVPSVNHKRVVRALERRDFKIVRQGKHITMTDGHHIVVIPRNNPIKRKTLLNILDGAGLTVEEFKELL